MSGGSYRGGAPAFRTMNDARRRASLERSIQLRRGPGECFH